MSDLTRSLRMIRLAERHVRQKIQYCGIDLFEARATDPLPLKIVHRRLSETEAQVRLVPGDLFSSLGRTANLLSDMDLVVIDCVHSDEALASVYPFFPRMLHADTSMARFDGNADSQTLHWLEVGEFMKAAARAA